MNGMPGYMPQGGQYVRMGEGGKAEIRTFRGWLHNLYLYDLITVASVLWEIWTLGPHLTIAVAILLSVWILRQYRWLCLFLVALSGLFLTAYYEALFDVWPMLFGLSPDQLPWVFWFLALLPAPVWWWAWWRGRFRNSTEVTDKYAPGPIKSREPHGGAVGPDNPFGDAGLLMVEEMPSSPQPIKREPLVVVVEQRDNGKLRARTRHELSEQLESKMPEIARLALDLQTPFSEPQMAGRGKPLSSKSFAPIRDELVALGALEWRDPDVPTSGVRWTIAGLDLCRRFNGHHPTPP